jgi:hypothetical protein
MKVGALGLARVATAPENASSSDVRPRDAEAGSHRRRQRCRRMFEREGEFR